MKKSFKLSCKEDVIDLIRDPKYQDAIIGGYDFSTYGNGHPQLSILSHDGYDIREDDVEFKLYRRNSLNKSMLQTDTDAYTAYSEGTLKTAIGSARATLQTHYDELLDKADKVQMELLYLMMLMRLRKRFDIKPVEHTENQWVKTPTYGNEYYCVRSNMVYRMFYRINGNELYWDVSVQSPALGKPQEIGGQNKTFKTEADLHKYLNGRIKAYDKYFQEVSPPVPDQYLGRFMYAGQMLPGYRAER